MGAGYSKTIEYRFGLTMAPKVTVEFKDPRAAMERIIEQRLDPAKALEGEEEMAKVWEAQARSSPSVKVYEKRLAEIWRTIGCVAEDAPYMIRALLVQMELDSSPFDEQSQAAQTRTNLPRRGALPRCARAHRRREGKAQSNPRPLSAASTKAVTASSTFKRRIKSGVAPPSRQTCNPYPYVSYWRYSEGVTVAFASRLRLQSGLWEVVQPRD
jgi:hypothetical protein